VFLIWSNVIWIVPNQRKNMLKCMPYIVFYAECLLLAQFLFGMQLTEDELPSSVFVNIILDFLPFFAVAYCEFSDQRRQHSRPAGLSQANRVRLPSTAPQVRFHDHVLGLVPPIHVGAGNREGPIGVGQYDGQSANNGGDGEADDEERCPRKDCNLGECNTGAILDMGGGVDTVHIRIFGQ
jgi:hypothetical protein